MKSLLKYINFCFYLLLLILLGIGAFNHVNYAQTYNLSLNNNTKSLYNLWKKYSQNIWFYGKNKNKIIPEVIKYFLIIKFTSVNDSFKGDLPETIGKFDSSIDNFVDYYIYDPTISSSIIVYKLKKGIEQENLPELLNKLQCIEKISYIHPALQIDNTLYATLNRIKIKWKTIVPEKKRVKLLQKVGGVNFAKNKEDKIENVKINESKMTVWNAANLLAEEIYISYAKPVYFEIKQPIVCDLSVKIPGANIGSPIPFKFKINFSDRIRIDPSSIVNLDLAPPNISKSLVDVNFDRPLSTVEVGQSPIVISGILYIYSPGEYTIPKVPIVYKFKSGDKVKVHQKNTEKINLKIASIIPSEQKNLQLKIAQEDDFNIDLVNFDKDRLIILIIILVSLIVIIVCCIFTWVSYNKQIKKPTQPEENITDKLYNSLIKWGKKEIGNIELQDIINFSYNLRLYIIKKYDITPSLIGGSYNVFLENVGHFIDTNTKHSLYYIFESLEECIVKEQVDSKKVIYCFRETNKLLQEIK